MLRLAYNTNGFPQHRVTDVAMILAELGYAGIAITPDVFHLDPFAGPAEARALRRRLDELDLAVAVETGARFLLDPRRKHQPTLLSAPSEARRRLDYLLRCLDLAVELRAETLSFWAGVGPPGVARELLVERLCLGAVAVLEAAEGSGVRVCLEPEPGMAVATLEELGEFLLVLAREHERDDLSVMLDVGHVPVTESIPPEDVVRAFGPKLGGVQLDDARDGVHEHLYFGEGVVDFTAVAAALEETGFAGLASVELPRHGHDPVTTARRAQEFFRGLRTGG